MRVTVLQHSDGTPPGFVLEWVKMNGHQLDLRQLHKGATLPAVAETELLVVLGGPMNVDDIDNHAWLALEKNYVRDVVASKRPCVGICLGGQMLAQVLGGTVLKNRHWEAGWQTVQLSNGRPLKVFQWHQDMFTLPPQAARLAGNAITENQAFRFGDRVVGMQFHPEATPEWVMECVEDKDHPTGRYVQTREEMCAGIQNIPDQKAWLFAMIDAAIGHQLAEIAPAL